MKPIYALKDRAVAGYEQPFTQPSEQHAIRWLRDIVNSDPEKSMIAKHPDDYDLYQVGEWNEEAGTLDPLEHPTCIVRAKDLINPQG